MATCIGAYAGATFYLCLLGLHADRIYGSQTKRAVKRFQRASRLTPSGTVGRRTVAALKRALGGAKQRAVAADDVEILAGAAGHRVAFPRGEGMLFHIGLASATLP